MLHKMAGKTIKLTGVLSRGPGLLPYCFQVRNSYTASVHALACRQHDVPSGLMRHVRNRLSGAACVLPGVFPRLPQNLDHFSSHPPQCTLLSAFMPRHALPLRQMPEYQSFRMQVPGYPVQKLAAALAASVLLIKHPHADVPHWWKYLRHTVKGANAPFNWGFDVKAPRCLVNEMFSLGEHFVLLDGSLHVSGHIWLLALHTFEGSNTHYCLQTRLPFVTLSSFDQSNRLPPQRTAPLAETVRQSK